MSADPLAHADARLDFITERAVESDATLVVSDDLQIYFQAIPVDPGALGRARTMVSITS